LRPNRAIAKRRRDRVSAGALILGIPATTVALSALPATSLAAAAPSGVKVDVSSHQVAYGHDVVVTGRAPRADAGQRVELEFAPAGVSSWHTITSTRVNARGRFRLAAPLWRSGLVQVVGPSSTATSPLSAIAAAFSSVAGGPERVTVAAALRVPGQINIRGGSTVILRGRLLPAVAGRRVTLEARTTGGWRNIGTARSGPRGGFHFRVHAAGPGIEHLRVRFAGDQLNGRSTRIAGPLVVYRQSVASWYYDGGNTACGFHAVYGVANRSLPCGTAVAFQYGGRTVTAVVDDRGPYVGGREWDLDQNTAGALGMGGVAVLWSSS
jgi:rare lipoprotein A